MYRCLSNLCWICGNRREENEKDGFFYLPEEHRAIHTACFELVRQIEEFIVGKDYEFLRVSHSDLTEEEKERRSGIIITL